MTPGLLAMRQKNQQMIRRDYILRMIEEFIQALARINSLKKTQRWDEASEALDAAFQRLVGEGAEAVTRLSETELLAKLDAEPDNAAIAEFGIAFYQRLLVQSDTALGEANLPRAEVEEVLKELQSRRK